ncbi:MAG TPA: ATP-binding protein [Candidatus Limnocylindria bacterium]|nr:ATP-binding protein [Candidatus Limnocylindria bacterium]
MSLTRVRDVAALLIALGAAIASIVVWDYGRVDIGMTVAFDDHGLTNPPGVIVADVTPDGNAARAGFSPLSPIIDLTTMNGADVERAPVNARLDGPIPIYNPNPSSIWDQLGPVAQELGTYERGEFSIPVEPVPSENIASATAGYVDTEAHWINVFGTIDRDGLEAVLRDSVWVMILGVVIGAAVWRFLAHGLGGDRGRELAVLLGVAAATPFLLLPVVQVGTPIGIYAGYLVPIGLSLFVGLSLLRTLSDPSWMRTAMAATFGAAALALLFVVRYMTSPALDPTQRGALVVLTAAVAVVPAAIVATGMARQFRPRAQLVSLALVPTLAVTLFTSPMPDPVLPVVLLGIALGWQFLPVERGVAAVAASMGHVRAVRLEPTRMAPIIATWRDRLTYALLGLVIVAGITQYNTWAVIVGTGLAALVGFAVRRGFLGDGWTDAAVPLAAAVGIPVIQLSFDYVPYSAANPTILVPVALAAVSVAHLLASRHSDPEWRWRIFAASLVPMALAVLAMAAGTSLAVVLVAFTPVIAGIPIALAEDGSESRAVRQRLETLVVALTPGAAATAVVAYIGLVVLIAWLAAVVIWRQFTLNPLMGLAQRTQLQRDLAVAAAETERARLAADLHDDALQQLTMLVRTLDEGGHKAEADEAREVATKLRSVVGDLRLPILDDLGAGAALEWLVERVEPLAGGPVKLERSDETRPPANVELAVFRVAQEALTNAIKHGKPPIAVRYDVRGDGRVTLAIDDAGEGIAGEAAEEAPKAGHFGLANMQQRAEQIGALLDVRRWPAGGTRVALEWRPQ